jgi:hypothetical protein
MQRSGSPESAVEIAPDLAAALASLSEALDQDDRRLYTELDALRMAVVAAVPSCVAMSVTIALDHHDATFTLGPTTASGPVATSLLIPLEVVSDARQGSVLILYATTPGAFVDLAADLSYATGVTPATFVLDRHPAPAVDDVGTTPLDGPSAINQALGVLIARGYTPQAALEELHRLAEQDGGQLEHAAQIVLDDLDGVSGDPA